jgi:hypothetical protein
VYGVLVAIIVLTQLMQTFMAIEINRGQASSWSTVIVVAALGALGLMLAQRCRFPEMLDTGIRNTQRYWLPFLMGTGLGVLMVVLDLFEPLGTDIQTPFPDAIIVFVQAGLVEEIVVHLFLTSLLVWLFSVKLFNNRYPDMVFWVIAVGVALAYWLFQISVILKFFPEKFTAMFALQSLFIILVTISLGAHYFRRYGFLAALSLRYGFYFVWHIVWAGGIGAIKYVI